MTEPYLDEVTESSIVLNTVTALIFAKAPAPGFAKTRLIPALGEHGAARLAGHLLEHTLLSAQQAGIGPVELCITPKPSHSMWDHFSFPSNIRLSTQCEGDLGARMARACLPRLLQTPVLLMGTDCIEMSPELLREAANALHNHDAVLYPTRDGGYALLGLRRFAANLFENIPWSTPEVAALTKTRIWENHWSLFLGPELRDLDEPEDLQWLIDLRSRGGADTDF